MYARPLSSVRTLCLPLNMAASMESGTAVSVLRGTVRNRSPPMLRLTRSDSVLAASGSATMVASCMNRLLLVREVQWDENIERGSETTVRQN